MYYLFILLLLVGLLWYFNGKGIPVILYHQVNKKVYMTPDLFEKHLKFIHSLKLKTYTVTEAVALVKTKGKLPKWSLLITFDDGYYDNYFYVYPLLKKYNLKATFFLNTIFIKEKAEARGESIIREANEVNKEAMQRFYTAGDARTDQYMTWPEINEMHESGLCDFQSHTHSHKLAFSRFKLKNISGKDYEQGQLNLFSGDTREGLPLLKSRGETSIRKIILNPSFIENFVNHYQEKLQALPTKQKIKEGIAYFNTLDQKTIGTLESEADAEKRIALEIKTNQQLIEKYIPSKVIAFAWPYGHSSQRKEIIKKQGIEVFLTCKKGANAQRINLEKVKRTELRKPSLLKFKVMMLTNCNLITGKIFSLIT
jgi:peptidoglycan/xylan/chitin deacetylase (PgdA/CDA1 family)